VTLKGQGHDPNIFKAVISKMARDRDSVTTGQWAPLGNGMDGIEWSRVL